MPSHFAWLAGTQRFRRDAATAPERGRSTTPLRLRAAPHLASTLVQSGSTKATTTWRIFSTHDLRPGGVHDAARCRRREFLCSRQPPGRAGAARAGAPLARGAARARLPAAPTSPVAIERCTSYDPQPLGQILRQALDLIGGIQPLVAGKTVTIKLNLTGGPRSKLGGLPAHRTYHVHPEFRCRHLRRVARGRGQEDRAGRKRLRSATVGRGDGGRRTGTFRMINCGRWWEGQLGGHSQQGAMERLQPFGGSVGRIHLSRVRLESALRKDRRVRVAGQVEGSRQRRRHHVGQEFVRHCAHLDLR